MPELLSGGWLLLAAAAVIVGVSKTALPGAGVLAVATFATILPARTSTAAVLLLLIVGDLFALVVYRRHAHWPTLAKLAPAVIAGLLVGFWFLAISSDSVVRRAIAVILLLMIAVTLWRRRRTDPPEPGDGGGHLQAAVYGGLGGFTTMVANAGGPVMSMYFLATRTPVQVFLGTSAWFFAVINLVKVPFLAGLGLYDADVLLTILMLVPAVVIGAFIGMRIAKRIDQQAFDRIVIALTIAGSLYLLF